MPGDAPVRRLRSVRLSDAEMKRAEAIGLGNKSSGVRWALRVADRQPTLEELFEYEGGDVDERAD